MKRLLAILVVAALALSATAAEDAKCEKSAGVPAAKAAEQNQQTLAEHLQAISVTIRAGNAEGSGVTVYRNGTTYVVTAGHVVDGLRRTREVVDGRTGTKRTVVEFGDAAVVRVLVEQGRRVGELELTAEVLRFSDAEHGEDIAILKVLKKDFVKDSAVFYLDDDLTPLGTPLVHVGSLLGSQGSNSMTSGIVSQHGRMIAKKDYLQTTCPAFPGSSGGGVFLADSGKQIGMLVRGAGESFNLCVPSQRLKAWADSAGVLWVLDPSLPVPSEAEISKMPIEDTGVKFQSSPHAAGPKPDEQNTRFLIVKKNECQP